MFYIFFAGAGSVFRPRFFFRLWRVASFKLISYRFVDAIVTNVTVVPVTIV